MEGGRGAGDIVIDANTDADIHADVNINADADINADAKIGVRSCLVARGVTLFHGSLTRRRGGR